MPARFLNLLNQPLLALNSLTAPLVPGIFFARSACNSLAFSQIIAYKTLSTANCCSLIHTNNNNVSTSSIVWDLCFLSTFTPFATSTSLISFFFAKMELIVDADFPYILRDRLRVCHFRNCYEFFLEFYHVFRLLYQEAGTQNFLLPHGGLFSCRTQ